MMKRIQNYYLYMSMRRCDARV